MRRIKLFLVMLVFAVPAGLAARVNASIPDHAELLKLLDTMGPAIYRDPWSVYAQLKEFEPGIEDAPQETKVLYYMRKAHALHNLYLNDEFEDALGSGRAMTSDATPMRTKLMLMILDGVARQRNGEYESGIAVQEDAARLAQANKLPFVHVFALVELAYTQSQSGRNETALSVLQLAYTLALNMDNAFLTAMVNEVYGVVYMYMGEYDRSIGHDLEALAAYEELGYRGYEAEATYGVALTYRNLKKWDEAMAMQKRLLIWESDYIQPLRDAGHLHGIIGKARGALSGFLDDTGYTQPPYYPASDGLRAELQTAFDRYWAGEW